MPVALQSINDIVERSVALQKELKKLNYAPNGQKDLTRRYSVTETARLVDRTPQAIREAEKKGHLRPPDRTANGRRLGYDLKQINDMRERFGTRAVRSRTEDDPCILAVQNFKGGVGKSTIAVHLAQYLARAGLRVLFIDCDSQASSTNLFGISPDIDLEDDDTLYPYFLGERRNPMYAIRDTYFDGLKLIPSNLTLYGAEYGLIARMKGSEERPVWFSLRDGIRDIQDDFDVIILDPPPALGMISLNVLYAANSVVVPMPPGMLDFASTIQFFSMLQEVMSAIGEHNQESVDLQYNFIKILISRKKARTNDTGSAQDAVLSLAREFYEGYLFDEIMYDSGEIEAATAAGKTVYELDGPTSNYRTYRRALASLDAVGAEIEREIRMAWPSHHRMAARRTATG